MSWVLFVYTGILALIAYAGLYLVDRLGTLAASKGVVLEPVLAAESEGVIEASTVPKIVWRIYSQVLNDKDLAPYFTGVNTPRIVNRQIEMFRAIGSGNVIPYSGEHLHNVHAHLNVPDEHFSRLIYIIREVYLYYDVPTETVAHVISVLETYRSLIVVEAK